MKRFVAALLVLCFSGGAYACSDPREPSFLSALDTGSNIFVFRVMSLRMIDRPVGDLDVISGPIQIVKTIKGKPSFQRVAYHDAACGGIQLIVGHYYIASTRQHGAVLAFVRGDNSVLDISDEFDKSARRWKQEQRTTDAIANHVAGKAMHKNLRTYLSWANLHNSPPPPPPRPSQD